MSGFETAVVDFNTIEELNQIEFVKRWVSKPEFVRLSKGKGVLMVEQNDSSHWGIAFLKNLEGLPTDLSELPLPEWTALGTGI
jgi:hypothetical protein